MSVQTAPVGPVDVAIVVFPESDIGSSLTDAIADAIGSGAVRLLDALIVQKDNNGKTMIIDIDDDTDAFALLPVSGAHQGLLTASDAEEVSDVLPPGATAMVVAWENMWAVRMRIAVHDAGGQIVAHERIAEDSLVGAFATLPSIEDGE
ncbi:DUF6325 family protein [Microlunatus soli]|uniref:DUF1269 domain-containing protein n=1 Tax=Microlunatus soli TaxID=630515 RepID=A0A1H1YY26_9ACTN|nr:DUF6325 family protein [Microlunatus soli]SDT26308.1 hypothetical protein SAMN04489812_4854 [Microlunatus soli]